MGVHLPENPQRLRRGRNNVNGRRKRLRLYLRATQYAQTPSLYLQCSTHIMLCLASPRLIDQRSLHGLYLTFKHVIDAFLTVCVFLIITCFIGKLVFFLGEARLEIA